MSGTAHATERKAAQGHRRARDLEARPGITERRCRTCRYLAIVFDTICSYGDFRTTRNATCQRWAPHREAAS